MHSLARRRLLAWMTGGGLAAIAGCLGGGDVEEETYGDWFANVGNFDGTEDRTGESDVAVDVGGDGGLAFAPPAIRVDVGTTVVWEWTGAGGRHNVVEEDGAFESGLHREAGTAFSHAFSEAGVYRYVCTPHEASGMRGAVHVVE